MSSQSHGKSQPHDLQSPNEDCEANEAISGHVKKLELPSQQSQRIGPSADRGVALEAKK